MRPQTMVEKILSRNVGRQVEFGEIVVAKPDLVYAHDGTAPLAIKVMRDAPEIYRVLDPGRVVFVVDHASPPPTVAAASVHREMRLFAKEFGVRLIDVGEGICHQVIPELGLVKPGDVVVGADSHTTTLGALASFATGVGSTDTAIAMALGKVWLRVPEAVKVVVTGELPVGVMGKDLALHIVGTVGADGMTYRAMEFWGDGLKHLSMDSRMTICNMGVEAGAKVALMPTDEVALNWFEGVGLHGVGRVVPDEGAEYVDTLEFELGRLEPVVAAPPSVDNVVPVSEVVGVEVDQVFIGSCTNGRYEDFLTAAKVFRGRRVREGVRCVAIPASRRVLTRLLRDGVVEVLVRAGCVVAHSTCGPCIGAHLGLLASGEVAVSTSNRNFVGRMGHEGSRVYLASPATAAASAVEGRVADPRKYLS